MAKIPTILEAGRADGKLATSNSIFDENKGMFQSELNDIQDTLNSDNPNKPLSAKQGKVLKELLDAKVIEAGSVPIDTEPTEGNTTHVVNSDGLAKEFNKCNTAIINTDRIENGAVTSEKISLSAFNSTLSVSGKIAPADVVGEKFTDLENEVSKLYGVVKISVPASIPIVESSISIDKGSETEVLYQVGDDGKKLTIYNTSQSTDGIISFKLPNTSVNKQYSFRAKITNASACVVGMLKLKSNNSDWFYKANKESDGYYYVSAPSQDAGTMYLYVKVNKNSALTPDNAVVISEITLIEGEKKDTIPSKRIADGLVTKESLAETLSANLENMSSDISKHDTEIKAHEEVISTMNGNIEVLNKLIKQQKDYGEDAISGEYVTYSADSRASVSVEGKRLSYASSLVGNKYIAFPLSLETDVEFDWSLKISDTSKIQSVSINAFSSTTGPGNVLNSLTKDGDTFVGTFMAKRQSDVFPTRFLVLKFINDAVSVNVDISVKKHGENDVSLADGIVALSSLSLSLQELLGNITASIQGESNLFVGKNCGISTIESKTSDDGRWNAAFGVNAMKDNTTGDHCTAFGFQAMQKNTTGDGNTGLGEDALYENQTGNSNTSVGAHNLQNCTGSQNTSVGTSGMMNLTSGAFNTQIGGYNGGKTLTTGMRNTLVGAGADVTNGRINDAIVIGMTSAKKDGQIRIGSERNTEVVIVLKEGESNVARKIIFNQDGTVTWEAEQ